MTEEKERRRNKKFRTKKQKVQNKETKSSEQRNKKFRTKKQKVQNKETIS
jgi:hypothetical protein